MTESRSYHQLSKEIQRCPLAFELGALHIDIINFEYVPPGPYWVVPNHQHSSYEFHFISTGKGYVTLEDKTFTVTKNQCYLTGPHVYHSQKTDEHDPMDECSLQCQIRLNASAPKHELEEAERILKLLNRPNGSNHVDTNGCIGIFFGVLREIQEKRIGYLMAIKQRMMELFIAAVRNLHGDKPNEPIELPMNHSDHSIVRHCILFLEDNYQNQITLEEAAASIHFSPRHLGRVFKTITGRTVHEYLMALRLNRARQLLEVSDESLEQIAQECGITNGSYLNTLFKKHFGISPNQHRKNCVLQKCNVNP
ncbi:AraC family transcriptional regulator [Paenibacillus taihuensis]|uniref:AraC family transcriptional regulator n=1 Tax=Paenibacillus taihuensis TaxID=1156355 RepID=A0A3D9RR68_9BACL|nr:AraC family transcriptional regulator [Paenibacillus taihuensis]REE77703.1 AraC family transcriptional regulator [Paenibacillus taihuensis]